MAVLSSKIYEIQLNVTGSDVNPTDELVLLLSGSGDASFVQITDITGSVSSWQAGRELSGSVLISEYNTAVASSGQDVFAARLQNTDGVCTGQLSGIVFFAGTPVTCFPISSNLGYDEATSTAACTAAIQPGGGNLVGYHSNNGDFDASITNLYSNNLCTPAAPGYYSDGLSWVLIAGELGEVASSGGCDL